MEWAVVVPIIAAISGALAGTLGTLVVKHRLDRGVETRAARRELYADLLKVLVAGRRILADASFAVDEPAADIDTQERLDALSARLEIDASPEVRQLAERCFRLIHRFNASHVMGAPVDVDEHGLFIYRFELVQDQPEHGRQLAMRFALGRISDEYRATVDKVSERVRREVHDGK